MFFLDGRSCFLGWRLRLLPNLTIKQDAEFQTIAKEVAQEMKLSQDIMFANRIPGYNDHPNNSARKLAEWFEETIKRMGYDIT
jgi:hypothetical protein